MNNIRLYEGARPAGIGEEWAGPSRKGTFTNHLSSCMKSNGMLDIRWAVECLHVQNVLNYQISSYSVRYWG